ncbi:DNA/RNA non-specific endonuclease [Streptomyces sp. NPDC006514]|uniref:DNA/RNA non-specific endonuclease n=1 Tax=Streptomyces sp. NPDC006514 TaxID=3154308 RepID=UPI0033B72EC2
MYVAATGTGKTVVGIRAALALRARLVLVVVPTLDLAVQTALAWRADGYTRHPTVRSRPRRSGLWGRLEDALFAEVEVDDLKVSAFGGPVFQEDDRLYRDVQISREFFKVLVFVEQGQLKAKAFLLTHNLNQLEALELDEFRVFQVALSEVESRGRFRFPAALRNADTLTVPEPLAARKPLEDLTDIDWR